MAARHGLDAYEEIKERILCLAYRPGEKLSEVRLAAQLGVGRSPVRTALQRLEAEGWIVVHPQSGTFIAKLSPEDVGELTELRTLLEAHTARKAAQALGDGQLRTLRAACDALKGKDLAAYIPDLEAFDDLFHTTIHEACGNGRIVKDLRNLRDQIRWVRRTNAARPGRLAESLAEMDRILEALERRDAAGAGALMERHIGNIGFAFHEVADAIEGEEKEEGQKKTA